jgi:hypothetical protein
VKAREWRALGLGRHLMTVGRHQLEVWPTENGYGYHIVTTNTRWAEVGYSRYASDLEAAKRRALRLLPKGAA